MTGALSLRVLRGSGPAVLGRWSVVAAASAGTGLLLLSALGWALGHPHGGTQHAFVRLAWCALPVAVTVRLAAAVARAQPAGWPRSGLSAVGLGRTGIVLLSAAITAVVCAAGSAVALLVFLQLRGDLSGAPLSGAVSGVLAAGRPLPPAGALTLLALVPLAAAAVAARASDGPAARPGSMAAPGGVPWGVALIAVGLAAEVTAPQGHAMPLPSGLGAISPGAAAGWVVTSAGMVLAGPGLVHACGRLLASFRPGALRLLSGRALQYESRRLGHPLGLLAATAAAALATYDLHHPLGPVTAFAAVLVTACVLASSAAALHETGRAREPQAAALRDLGASPRLLRSALALRTAVLLAAAVPLTLLISALATIPRPR